MAGELEPKKKTNWIESTRTYLSDIRSEMKRVTWPNRDRVQSTTLVVMQKTVLKVEQTLTK
jgi:preprotein translocase subunit SecE